MDYNGEVFSASNATEANLSRAIRFKLVNLNTGAVTSVVHDTNTESVWIEAGNTMTGNLYTHSAYLTVGGFHDNSTDPTNTANPWAIDGIDNFHGAIRHLPLIL